VEDSLRRLQIETIDLYQCHFPDTGTPIEETLRAFDDLVKAGKVRHIGASNYTVPLLEEALAVAREKSLPEFVSLQPKYNLVHRGEFEGPLADLCLHEGIAVIPYSPLAGGFLTGKYRRDLPRPQTPRAHQASSYGTEAGWRVVDALEAIAKAHSTTIPAVALAWLLPKPTIAAPIIGANSPQQLADLLPAAELRLTPDEMASLDAVSMEGD
jgi:aryl-alcohol dehydrogenase-like predicted oxidoreductase